MKDDTVFWMRLSFVVFIVLIVIGVVKGCSGVLNYHYSRQHVKVLNVINNAVINDPETTCEAVEYELKKCGIDSLHFVPVRYANQPNVIHWELAVRP